MDWAAIAEAQEDKRVSIQSPPPQ